MNRRTLFAGWMLGVAAALASCGGDDGSGGSDAEPVAPGGTVEVQMLDNSFRPNKVSVAAGSTVTFELPNKGKLPHNMHIASARGVYRESPWVSKPEVTNGGERGTLTWEVPAEPGDYKFRCDFHEVEMTGTLTVK